MNMSNFSKSINNNLQQKAAGMGLKGMISGNQTTKAALVPVQEQEETIPLIQPITASDKTVQKFKKESSKRLPVDLPIKLYERLGMKKVKTKLSMRELIINALEQYLEK